MAEVIAHLGEGQGFPVEDCPYRIPLGGGAYRRPRKQGDEQQASQKPGCQTRARDAGSGHTPPLLSHSGV
jgi:hypothetical protein